LSQALDKFSETVIVGVELHDIETFSIEQTPVTHAKVAPMIDMVLSELDRLDTPYEKRKEKYVSGNPI